MKNSGSKISNRKLRGEWAEMCFMARAAEHGLQVNKPWGEMARYDFVIGHEGQFVRVQVKSTMARLGTGYTCTVRGGHRPYEDDVFDFLAAYLVPDDVWYIIPAALVSGQGCVTLYPRSKNSKYAPYKEAWSLLRSRPEASPDTIAEIQACADELLARLETGLYEAPPSNPVASATGLQNRQTCPLECANLL
jgi:hypothetical protein